MILTACASPGTPTTLRGLPTTLSADAERLLAGCTLVDSDADLELHCDDGIVVASQQQPEGVEPGYIHAGDVLARSQGTSVTWQEETLQTDRGSVSLRVAVVGPQVVMGVSRPEGPLREDLWCLGPQRQRHHCTSVLTALLQPAAIAPPRAGPAGPGRVAQPALRGRSLSLPTTCSVDNQSQLAGHYTCDGLTMQWRVVDDMDAVAVELNSLFAAHPTTEPPRILPCRLGYQDAICRGTPMLVTGTTYVDGVGVVALCANTGVIDVRAAEPCRTLMNGSW